MKKIIRCALLIGLPLLLTTNAYSANHHLRGEIKNISAITDGLLIMLDTAIPDNCSGTPYGWMLIKQDRTLIDGINCLGIR